jgi:endonuclease-3
LGGQPDDERELAGEVVHAAGGHQRQARLHGGGGEHRVVGERADADVGDAFGKPAITVDTHFSRLARRFGRTAQTDPDKIERDVAGLLPPREWTLASHRLIWHGRRVCHARLPACGACGVARWYPSFGIGPTDEATAGKLVKTGPFS